MNDPSYDPAALELRFGSPNRRGRDDPAYQQSRLHALVRFQTTLVTAYRRRLLEQQRAGRDVWDQSRWLEHERERWQARATEHEAKIHELQGWVAELEEAKAWLLKTKEEHEAYIRTLEAQVGERSGGE